MNKYIEHNTKHCVIAKEQPKNFMSRPLAWQGDSRSYQSFHIYLSPVDFGIPSSRKRLYSWYRLTPVVVCLLASQQMVDAFQDMFFSRCVLTSSIYMVLPEDKLTAYRRHWCELRGEDWCELQGDMVQILGPFAKAEYRVRLLKFDTQGQSRQSRSPHPAHMVNVHQTPNFGKNESSFAPSLLQEPSPSYSKS